MAELHVRRKKGRGIEGIYSCRETRVHCKLSRLNDHGRKYRSRQLQSPVRAHAH